MSYSVYKHTFPNGKVYIGITSLKPEDRWNYGYGYLYKKNNKYLQPLMAYAIQKYGWENVEHEILFNNLKKEDAEKKEIELISLYKSNDREFGYNIASGGNANDGMKGRRHSNESKEKNSMAHKGKKMSDAAKKNMSKAQKGKILSEEHKKKISVSHKGKTRPEELMKRIGENNKKSVLCVETGIIYDSIKKASEDTGVCKTTIGKVCNHIYRHKTAGGYHWEFVNKDIERSA